MTGIMNSPMQDNDEAMLAELTARARELESELAGIQSAIAILQARMNNGNIPAGGTMEEQSPVWGDGAQPPMPAEYYATEEAVEDNSMIHLQALQPHHALRNKWELGSGLENAEGEVQELEIPAEEAPVATELRLYGLLSSGEPWEQRIPFSFIASDNAVIIGRDAENANVVLAEASVSRAHVQFTLSEYGLVVSDLGSTNGTAVNGEPLTAYDNYRAIQNGDTITVGSINLQVEFI